MRLILVLTAVTLVSGCSDPEPAPVRGDPHARNFPLASVEADPQPPMKFDPSQPYRLKFGRGSGWDGLDTIEIDQTGQVVLYRSKKDWDGGVIRHFWETASGSIDAGTAQNIGESIRDCHLLEMNCAYHADVHDGSQWVFRLTQGAEQKYIYFNNVFPEAIQDFAVGLDRELKEGGVDVVEWKPVPEELEREHEKDLWESGED